MTESEKQSAIAYLGVVSANRASLNMQFWVVQAGFWSASSIVVSFGVGQKELGQPIVGFVIALAAALCAARLLRYIVQLEDLQKRAEHVAIAEDLRMFSDQPFGAWESRSGLLQRVAMLHASTKLIGVLVPLLAAVAWAVIFFVRLQASEG